MVYTPFLAGQRLTAGLLNERLVQELMPWTPIDDIGNFSANGSPGTMIPSMRKVMFLGEEEWHFRGRINTTGITAANVFTLFTFDVGYRVGSERGFEVYAAQSLHYPARLGFNSNGTLTLSVPSAAGNTTSIAWADCIIRNPSL